MNLLFYTPNYLPATRYGGPIRSSHGLARALVELGHGVEVVTTTVDGRGSLDIADGTRREIDGVGVTYFNVRAPRRIYYCPKLLDFVRRSLARFDVVHINGIYLWPGKAIAQAAATAGKPYVVSPRGMLVPEMIAGKSALAKMAWIALFERRALAGAAAIHATSNEERDGIQRAGFAPAHLRVIPNGVDVPAKLPQDGDGERFWRGIPKGERIAFLGRLDWTKGVEIAADAVSDMKSGTLVVAGPDQIGVQQAIESNLEIVGAAHRVRFIGPLDDDAKWAFLKGADVLVVPSLKESFGLSAAEMLAIGGTVVCSNGVGLAALISSIDDACVVPRTRAAFAQAIGLMLRDGTRRAAFGETARRIMAAEYTWAAIARQMCALYETVISEKGQRLAHAT